MRLKRSYTEEDLQRRLRESRAPAGGLAHMPISPGLREAAVLVPLVRIDADWNLLFIRRAENRRDRHSGEVAFPGGRRDPGDAHPEAVALREAWEEMGIVPDDVRLLGRLREFVSSSRYRVTPVAGVMPWPYPVRPERAEVGRCFTIPLHWLADPGNHEMRTHRLGSGERIRVPWFKPWDGEVLWGLTAAIVLELIERLSAGSDSQGADG